MRFKKVYIEITNACNLNCSFCILNHRPIKYMSFEEFKLILKKLEGYTKYLYFHILGEPLIHPQINEFINYASQKLFINITTNGYLIANIKHNLHIRQLNISLHSYNPKYQKTLKNYLDDIIDSVEILHQNNTIINYRIWSQREYVEDIIKYLNKYYDSSIKNQQNLKIKDRIFIEFKNEFTWPSLDNNYYNTYGSCRALKDHIGILSNGTVIPCCLDSQGTIKLGDIYKQDLSDIINSSKFKNIEEGFVNNKKVELLCCKCSYKVGK